MEFRIFRLDTFHGRRDDGHADDIDDVILAGDQTDEICRSGAAGKEGPKFTSSAQAPPQKASNGDARAAKAACSAAAHRSAAVATFQRALV